MKAHVKSYAHRRRYSHECALFGLPAQFPLQHSTLSLQKVPAAKHCQIAAQ
jgi:hypothetical protein